MSQKNDILNMNNGHIPQNITDIFREEAQRKQVTIHLSVQDTELCELKFDLDTLGQPCQSVNKVVATTVEELLNKLPQLELVQNKM